MANKRRPIRLGVRFEIFKRDAFTCQYCGKRPPEALLEVDHIVAVSSGGTNDEGNLVTSCFECNRGKSNRSLGNLAPAPGSDRAAELEERALQSKAYAEAVMLRNGVIENMVSDFLLLWIDSFGRGNNIPSERSLKMFLDRMSLQDLQNCMVITASRNPNNPVPYFYGVCWRHLKGQNT